MSRFRWIAGLGLIALGLVSGLNGMGCICAAVGAIVLTDNKEEKQ